MDADDRGRRAKPPGALASLREGVAVGGIGLGMSGAVGTLAAIVARTVSNISEHDALLFVGLPIAIVLFAFYWPRLPKILGFRQDAEP